MIVLYEIFRWFGLLTGWPVQFAWFTRKTYYEDRKAQGRIVKGGALIISNHYNVLDYIANVFLFAFRKLHVVYAKTSSKWAIFGMNFFGGIPVDRSATHMPFIQTSVDLLKRGKLVQIYPEAHITRDGNMLPFKPSYIYIALRAGVPTIPFLMIGLLVGILFVILSFFIVAFILFSIFLKRTKKEKWSRTCSNEEQAQREMYDIGMRWYEENKGHKTDLHIVNEGLNLYGEYYDFGYRRAVIIVPGRTESLRYGYYFAKPYVESGYNLLVIDQRAHGDSDGKYNTVGFDEHRDLLVWANHIHVRFDVEAIVLHGICIGASCSLFAMTAENCPDYIEGMVAEGMYPTFYDSFKNHMIALKKPTFPYMALIHMWMKLHTGHSMKYGPIHVIGKYKKPLLMIHSKEDLYSLPSAAAELYEAAGSENKELFWFEKGAHSQLRLVDTEAYDRAIVGFLKKLPSSKSEAIEEGTRK